MMFRRFTRSFYHVRRIASEACYVACGLDARRIGADADGIHVTVSGRPQSGT